MDLTRYKTAFPNHPTPDASLLAVLEAYGLTDDVSWHHDLSPSFMLPTGGWQLWCNHADPEQRETPTTPRFVLMQDDSNNIMQPVPNGTADSLPELQLMLARHMPVWPDVKLAQDSALQPLIRRIEAQAYDAAAQCLEVRNQDLLLMAGEMTAQELRTAQAILKAKAAEIRRLADRPHPAQRP